VGIPFVFLGGGLQKWMKVGPQMTGDKPATEAWQSPFLCGNKHKFPTHHVARGVSEMLVQHTFNSFQPLGLCLVGSWGKYPFLCKEHQKKEENG
jgi:hypothetical protein